VRRRWRESDEEGWATAPEAGDVVGEAEFLGDGRGDDEWIETWFAEAEGDLVEDGGEAGPALESGYEGMVVGGASVGELWWKRCGVGGNRDEREREVMGVDAGVTAGFHGFGEVKVVSPCFGPVFGGMGRGVGADEGGFPAGGRAARVVTGEGCGVV